MMAIDPHTAKLIAQAVISKITDEEKRQKMIIGIIAGVTIFILVIATPMFLVESAWEDVQEFFGFKTEEEFHSSHIYKTLYKVKTEYGYELNIGELNFNGKLPMPVIKPIITSAFGTRKHPISGQINFHSGIDLASKWHSPVMSVLDGKVVFAGVSGSYGNCVKIEHNYGEETIFTLYAHLAEIDVVQGQEVIQGTIIGTQGGDPLRDKNPGSSTGTHLHFEIRKSSGGDFVDPALYLFVGE